LGIDNANGVREFQPRTSSWVYTSGRYLFNAEGVEEFDNPFRVEGYKKASVTQRVALGWNSRTPSVFFISQFRNSSG
jgi:hypothetical protein